MFIRFSRVFTIVCVLTMSITILPPSSGDHNNSGGYQSVFASASCSEFERIQGYHWYTVHQAVARARANIHNDLGDYNGGWYGIGATVNGTSDAAGFPQHSLCRRRHTMNSLKQPCFHEQSVFAWRVSCSCSPVRRLP